MKEWIYFEKALADEVCEGLLKDIKTIPVHDGTVEIADTFQVSEKSRRSKIRFLQTTDRHFDWLFRDLWELSDVANRNFNFNITELSFVQIAEYDSSYLGEYREHKDLVWNADKHRKLSCTIQLSSPEDYDGGEFLLHRLDASIPNKEDAGKINKRGTAIFFTPFTYHSISPVTRGTRYSLTAWFEGPKWR